MLIHKNSGEYQADDLANLCGIRVKAALRILKSTTLLATRHINGKVHRSIRIKMHQRQYRELWIFLSRFSSDIFKSKVKSLRGNQYFQLFCNSGVFAKVYPMKGKKESHLALNRFLHEIGIPSKLHTDGAGELVHVDCRGEMYCGHKLV